MTVYATVSKEARKVVKHYLSDLAIDREEINKYPNVPFIHVSRESGTFCTFLFPADHDYWPRRGESVPYLFGTADRRNIAKGFVDSIRFMLREYASNGKWLYHDGQGTVREVRPDTAMNITTIWFHRLIAEWNKA